MDSNERPEHLKSCGRGKLPKASFPTWWCQHVMMMSWCLDPICAFAWFVLAVESLMFRKERFESVWMFLESWLGQIDYPAVFAAKLLHFFSWQQPHAGACTFASKHIGRLDSKKYAEVISPEKPFWQIYKKKNGSIASNQGPLNHDFHHASFLVTSGPVYPISILKLSGDMEWAGTAQWPGKKVR